MLRLDDPANFARTLAGLAMVAAPVTWAVAGLIRLGTFPGHATEEQLLAAVAADPGAWQLMTVVDMIGVILFVPAVLGMIHLARGRAPVLAHIGGALSMIGMLGAAGHNVFGNVLTGGMARVEGSRGAMVDLGTRMEQTPGFLLVLLMFLVGYVIGFVVLAVALYRSGTLGRAATAAMVLAMLVGSNAGDSLPLTLVSSLLLTLGMGAAARRTLSTSDTEWALGTRTRGTSDVPAAAGAAGLS